MRGIDISHHQGNIQIDRVDADFVICKATEGNGYTDPRFTQFAPAIKSAGRLRGIYHFARADLNPGTAGAKREAAWFAKTVEPYVDGETLLVLDWEAGSITHGPAWAKTWLQEVERLTGVRPVMYTYHAVINSYDWSGLTDYPLWYARYPSSARSGYRDMPQPKVKHWGAPIIWQYTSSGDLPGHTGRLDLNAAYITAAEWKHLAAPTKDQPTGGDLVAAAREYLGVPYVFGGTTKDGLDCSGLIVRALEDLGARGSFPRVSGDQINATTPITVQEALDTPGALVWFDGHDGLTLGDGKSTIEAVVNPGNRVQIFAAPSRWKRGGLIPGINYQKKGAPTVAGMVSPVEGRVTSEFSHSRRNPATGRQEPHYGIDIAAPIGTPIYATYAGTVTGVGAGLLPGRSGDRNILIQNPDGERQYYGHNDTALVRVGQKVAAGEQIATVGARGNVTGPHLHLEIHDKNGTPRNLRIDFNHHGIAPGSPPVTNTQSSGRDWFSMATKNDLKDAIWEVLSDHNISISGATQRALNTDKRSAFSLLRYAAADLFEGRERHTETTARLEAMTAAVKALAESQGLDPGDVTTAVESAVERALADLSITLTVEGDQ